MICLVSGPFRHHTTFLSPPSTTRFSFLSQFPAISGCWKSWRRARRASETAPSATVWKKEAQTTHDVCDWRRAPPQGRAFLSLTPLHLSSLPLPPEPLASPPLIPNPSGMDDGEDMMMRNWTGTIIGPANSVHDGRIYTVKIHCGDNYPLQPPQVRRPAETGQDHLVLPCPVRVVISSCSLVCVREWL